MNWQAVFTIWAIVCGLGTIGVGMDYIDWDYPSLHKTQRNWLIGLFFATIAFGGLAAGLAR